LKIFPNGIREKPVLKLMFAALIHARAMERIALHRNVNSLPLGRGPTLRADQAWAARQSHNQRHRYRRRAQSYWRRCDEGKAQFPLRARPASAPCSAQPSDVTLSRQPPYEPAQCLLQRFQNSNRMRRMELRLSWFKGPCSFKESLY